jgi:hypothetical protein
LYQNFSNPFNPITTINYSIHEPAIVQVKVFNLLGMHEETIVDRYHSAGDYEIIFDAANLSSGIYFYELTAGNSKQTKRMMLIK